MIDWMAKQPGFTAAAIIPNASPAYLSSYAKMFDNETVYFGKDRKTHMVCRSREEADLVKYLANLGVHGAIHLPEKADECAKLREEIERRLHLAKSRFEELAQTRTSLEEKQGEVVELLLRWFVLGRQVRTAHDPIQ